MKKKENHTTSFDLDRLADNWESPIVVRNQVQLDRFSGGLLNAKTMANHDSLRTGPEGKIRIGNKVAYPTESLVKWLKGRVEKTAA